LAPKNYKAEKELQSQTFQLCNFWHQNIGEKSEHKMLMKLTPNEEFLAKTSKAARIAAVETVRFASLIQTE